MNETMSEPETVVCMNDSGDGTCRGEVEFHSIDPGRRRAFPRCEFHWTKRLEQRENSMERYADSDVRPGWFDEADAGEHWDDEY